MKYTKETVGRIIEGIEKLYGRVGACKYAGISYETFTRWMEEKNELNELIKKAEDRAEDKGKEMAILSIFKAIDKGIWQAGAWWLERKYNHIYAIKNKIEHSGEIKNINLNGLNTADLLTLAKLYGHNETDAGTEK